MATINRRVLLEWLRERAALERSLIQSAVYEGLAARIERGEFDEGEES